MAFAIKYSVQGKMRKRTKERVEVDVVEREESTRMAVVEKTASGTRSSHTIAIP